MYKLKILLIGIAVNIATIACAQQSRNFVYEPEMPRPGQKVEITYDPSGTPLAGKKDIHAVVYAYNNYHWQVSDLGLTPAADNKFMASLTLDKDCGLATFKFIAGDSTDNNRDMSYTIMTAGPAGSPYNAPGAYAGWGLLRAERFGYGIPGYFKTPKISDTAFYYWMNNEIMRHPQESSEALAVPFAKGVYAYQGKNGIKRINNVIAFLNHKGGEENQLKVRAIYHEVLGRRKSVDSLDSIMVKRYPKGDVAALKAYNQLNLERDYNKKMALSEQFLLDFPKKNANPDFDEENRISYSTVCQNVIILNVMNKNYAILDKYVNELPYYAVIEIYYKIIEIAHNRKDIPDDKLYPYAKMLVDKMETFRNRQPVRFWYLSPTEWRQQFEKDLVNNFLITQVNLLKNIGKYDQALSYALEAQDFLKYKSAALNNDEVFLLKKKGETAEVNDVLIKSMYENQSTPEMIDMLKANYVAKYKSDEGFDKYLESLKNASLSLNSNTKAKMINKAMPDWAMYDQNGKLIRFKDLRGKTIVMDFWATWCVPCKASFPGMKLAVEKYKGDPSVQFYFVDTEERTADYKARVGKFIKDNHYPFHILFDNKVGKGTLTEEVYDKICKAFGISGIPQKLIIDKTGHVRFISIGYMGSPSALADDISRMVELTKQQN